MVNPATKGTILHLSDSPLNVTGYAHVSKILMNGMQKRGYDCLYLPNQLWTYPMRKVEFVDGTRLDFTTLAGGKEPYSLDQIAPLMRKYKPDIFGILQDLFMLYPRLLDIDTTPAKTYFYYPSDGGRDEASEDHPGGILPLGCEKILEKVDMPIAMSKFAQKQTKNIHGIKAEYVPHGVQTNTFFPMPEKKEALKAQLGFRNKFVIGSVYRNQPRKQPDKLIKGFSVFHKKRPDSVLYLHTDPYDMSAIFDTVTLARQWGVADSVFFTGMRFNEGISVKELNEYYNTLDCHLLSTSGEGFGIPTVEAMSCGIPSCTTDYTTTKELVLDHGAGLGMEVATEITGSWNVDRAIPSVKGVTDTLETLYADPQLRERFGKNGRKAVLEFYDYDTVVLPLWEKLMEKLLNK